MSVKAHETTTTTFECDVHGYIGHEQACPYCDKCEHGVTRFGHCNKCNHDESWQDAPLSEDEIQQVLRTLRSCSLGLFRYPRKPRNYHSAELVPKFISEFLALRQASKQAG